MVDGHENKIFLMTKMPTRRFLRLGGGRKMNISVFQIDGGTFENTGRHRIIPELRGADLVNMGHDDNSRSMASFIASTRVWRNVSSRGAGLPKPQIGPGQASSSCRLATTWT